MTVVEKYKIKVWLIDSNFEISNITVGDIKKKK